MKTFLKKHLSHDVHPVVQFIKYGIVGGMATGLHAVTFFLVAWLLFPCLTEDDIAVKLFKFLGYTVSTLQGDDHSTVKLLGGLVTLSVRALNAIYCTIIGFTISNVFCYILNRLFVFKPGKHHIIREFLLFFGVSAISQIVSTSLQTVLINKMDIQTTYAFGANIFCALLINYATRKFLIFKS